MLKYIFSFLMLIHGLIHFMGFAKAYSFGNITQLTKEISKANGLLWLATALFFIIATMLFLLKKDNWLYIVAIAAVISQILIVASWQDAKFGTIVNVIVMFVAIAAFSSQYFESIFHKDVKLNLLKTSSNQTDLLTEADIGLLPLPVKKYLRYCNVLNKPKVKNIRVVFDGEMRDKGKDWFKFTSVQYNFFDEPTRFFFMKAKMYGIIVPGYHIYQNTTASMQIKLFGLFDVVSISGAIMTKAETVTVFNDMCLMAPATLIDKRIEWTVIDGLSAKATFTNGVNKITAVLYFNEKGQLINFVSDDRYAIDGKQYRFSTPVNDYAQVNGNTIWKYGEAVWHYPDGEFVYGKFRLKSIAYNVMD